MTEQEVKYEIEQVKLGTIQASSPQDIVVRATAMAKTLANIITEQNLYTNIQGRKYVNVEGWTTLGAMLGIFPREVSVKENENGDYEAEVELIRATDGAVVGRATSIVGMDEPTWAKRQRYARRSMSVTRATGKAYRLGFSWIMKLAGYEPTPAEEMPVEGTFKDVTPRPKKQGKPITREDVLDAEPEYDFKTRPYDAATLKAALEIKANKIGSYDASDKQRGLLAALLSEYYQDDTKRHEASEWLFGHASTKEIDGAMVKTALDWLAPQKDDGGAYAIDRNASKELSQVLTVALEAAGQEALL